MQDFTDEEYYPLIDLLNVMKRKMIWKIPSMCNYSIPRVGTVLITLELTKKIYIYEKAIDFMLPKHHTLLGIFQWQNNNENDK